MNKNMKEVSVQEVVVERGLLIDLKEVLLDKYMIDSTYMADDQLQEFYALIGRLTVALELNK